MRGSNYLTIVWHDIRSYEKLGHEFPFELDIAALKFGLRLEAAGTFTNKKMNSIENRRFFRERKYLTLMDLKAMLTQEGHTEWRLFVAFS